LVGSPKPPLFEGVWLKHLRVFCFVEAKLRHPRLIADRRRHPLTSS
jgi:hypothetical protein